MGANSGDADYLNGLFIARRRRRRGSADLLVKNDPNAAAPVVFGDWLFDSASGNTGSFATTAANAVSAISGIQINPGSFSITTANSISDIVSQSSNTGSFTITSAAAIAGIAGNQLNVGLFSATTNAIAAISGAQVNGGSFSASTVVVSAVSGSQVNAGLISVSTIATALISGAQEIAGSFSIAAQDAVADIQTSNIGSFSAITNVAANIFGEQTQIGKSHDPHRYDFTMDMDALRKKPAVKKEEVILEELVVEIVSRETDSAVELAEDLANYSKTIQTLVDSAVEEYEQMESARKISRQLLEEKQLSHDEFALILCIAELL